MDTFLLESDTPTKVQQLQEQERAKAFIDLHGEGAKIKANVLYKERLHTALMESQKLFNDGKVCRIVYSGDKSYHLLVRVSDEPNDIDEYKWLHAYLCSHISDKLIFDESTSDPARLTRSPLTMERVTNAYDLEVVGEQKLVAEDWSHVYTLDWRPLYAQWQNRPLKPYEQRSGKPLIPTRPEYREAMEALIDKSFWTDSKYDGQRQTLFFPGYRLLRLLGYSHDELWSGILAEGIATYKKADERGYWLSRADSEIIAQIDGAINEYNEKWEAE